MRPSQVWRRTRAALLSNSAGAEYQVTHGTLHPIYSRQQIALKSFFAYEYAGSKLVKSLRLCQIVWKDGTESDPNIE
jgi:hypothetical protein